MDFIDAPDESGKTNNSKVDNMYVTYRNAVIDPAHFNNDLWAESTLRFIQDETNIRLQQQNIKLTVPFDQIRNVVDSISQSNPRVGTKEVVNMVISYMVSYIVNEETVNNTPAYDSTILKYDGTFGIQRYSTGQLSIKKKKLNTFGRMF
jgi:hypothetical protein